jgi:hypothetical protein
MAVLSNYAPDSLIRMMDFVIFVELRKCMKGPMDPHEYKIIHKLNFEDCCKKLPRCGQLIY